MTEMDILLRRVGKVELQYRRLQRSAVLGVVVVCAVLIMGQGTRPPIFGPIPRPGGAVVVQEVNVQERVTARQFVLVDRDGKERASLVSDGAGSVFFVLFDRNEKARADFSVSNYGPSINFYDPSGQSRAIIGSTTLVSSHIADEAGIVERNPPSSIVLFDSRGKLLWRTP